MLIRSKSGGGSITFYIFGHLRAIKRSVRKLILISMKKEGIPSEMLMQIYEKKSILKNKSLKIRMLCL